MSPFIELLVEPFTLPFMQRAFLVGVALAGVMAMLGAIATLKKMAFFTEGIAHASLAGIAIGILAGFTPLPVALAWGVLIALVIYRLEKTTLLSSDTLIGILFTFSMALGVVLMHYTSGYQPELISFLFGSILSITASDVPIILIGSAVILTWFFASRRSLTFLALHPDSAAIAGVRVQRQTLLFYISLAVATVLTVKLLGIVLVSALLVIPPASARMLSGSFAGYLVFSFLFAQAAIILGLLLSYYSDLPSGAVIVLLGTIFFFFALAAKTFSR